MNNAAQHKEIAENHAAIARKVYPDVMIFTNEDCEHDPYKGYLEGCCGIGNKLNRFSLLEVDDNGNPTQQAKASAWDTQLALKINVYKCGDEFFCQWNSRPCEGSEKRTVMCKNPCEAIYKAACEVVREIKDE